MLSLFGSVQWGCCKMWWRYGPLKYLFTEWRCRGLSLQAHHCVSQYRMDFGAVTTNPHLFALKQQSSIFHLHNSPIAGQLGALLPMTLLLLGWQNFDGHHGKKKDRYDKLHTCSENFYPERTHHFYLYLVAKVNHVAMTSPNSKLQGSMTLPKPEQDIWSTTDDLHVATARDLCRTVRRAHLSWVLTTSTHGFKHVAHTVSWKL